MGAHTRNPGAGDAGARESRAGRLDGPKNSPDLHDLQASAAVERLLVRLGDRLRCPGLTDFEAGFIKSILSKARRGGPRWQPSDRQRAMAEKILAEQEGETEESLIEELDS